MDSVKRVCGLEKKENEKKRKNNTFLTCRRSTSSFLAINHTSNAMIITILDWGRGWGCVRRTIRGKSKTTLDRERGGRRGDCFRQEWIRMGSEDILLLVVGRVSCDKGRKEGIYFERQFEFLVKEKRAFVS